MDNNYKKNNDLEDKAWAKMRAILDEEMQVKTVFILEENNVKEDKKKRRFGFIFWLLLGAASVLGLGYFTGFNKNNKANLVENKSIENSVELAEINKNNPLKKTEKRLNTEGVTLNSFSAKNKINKGFKLNKKEENSATINEESKPNFIKKNKTQIIENQLVISIDKLEKIVENDGNKIAGTDILEDKNQVHQLIDNAVENSNDAENKAINKDILATDEIAILEPKIINFETTANTINALNSIIKSNKNVPKKWSYGLLLGLNIEPALSMSANTIGGVGGVFIQRELSAKWSLSMGLNYRVLVKENENITYLQNADSVQQKSINATTLPTTNSSITRVNEVYLKYLHYVEIPLQINYRISSKIAFSSGIKASILINQSLSSAISDKALYLLRSGTNPSASLDQFQKSYIAADQASSTVLGLNKFDLGIIGGVSYQWNKHFSTQLRYDFGLNNIYKVNANIHNRYLGINGLYRF